MSKLIIKTDITDWNEEFNAEEPNVMSDEDIIRLRMKGVHPAAIGRYVIVAREHGHIPPDTIKSNKVLLNIGASADVTAKTQKKKKVTLSNGKDVNVREYVAPIPNGKENILVKSNSKVAVDHAINYLLKVCTGRIYNRLAIIASNEGDVRKYGDELKAVIDEIVGKLE